MKVRKVVGAVLATRRLDRAVIARPARRSSEQTTSRSRSSPTSAGSTTSSFNQLASTGRLRAKQGARHPDAASTVDEDGGGADPEPAGGAAARLRARSFAHGLPQCDACVNRSRRQFPRHAVRDHRLSGTVAVLRKGKPEERHGHDLRRAGVRLPRRLHRGAHGQEAGRPAGHRRRRRHQDPVGRDSWIAGYIRREEGEQEDQGPRRLLARTSATGEVQGDRARTRSPRARRRLPGRRRLRPRRARGCRGGEDLGHRRRRRPVRPRPARADERRQARRRRRVPAFIEAREDRHARRRQLHLRPRERRRRASAKISPKVPKAIVASTKASGS